MDDKERFNATASAVMVGSKNNLMEDLADVEVPEWALERTS